jgi:hypothetical protein
MRASISEQKAAGAVANPMNPGRTSYGGQVTSQDGRAGSKEAPEALTEL